jgi:hypothetical protein
LPIASADYEKLLFLLIGIGVMILIDLIRNREENVRDFREGFEEGYNQVRVASAWAIRR